MVLYKLIELKKQQMEEQMRQMEEQMKQLKEQQSEMQNMMNIETTTNDNPFWDVRDDVDYSDEYLEELRCDANSLRFKIKRMLKGYENQQACAMEVKRQLVRKHVINVMVIALTQSGKTGLINEILYTYLEDNIIPIENIYIITGLSSKEWREQTQHSLPKSLHNNIYHRPDLNKKFVENIQNKKNVLVIMDEVQIAACGNQSIDQAFSKVGFDNKETLLNNDVKIIELTATPDGTIYDLAKWGEHSEVVKMTPGDNYMSCFKLKEQNRVLQYQNLFKINKKTDELEESSKHSIKELNDTMKRFNNPRYHIVRKPPGKNITDILRENMDEDVEFVKFNQESKFNDLNEKYLDKKPTKHTVIVIDEKLRCAIRLTKKYIGVVYERYTDIVNDSVIIQGLLGRVTGYDDNGDSIVFTYPNTIDRYENLWDNNFGITNVQWRSKTAKSKRGGDIQAVCTFNNPGWVEDTKKGNERSPCSRPIIKFKIAEKHRDLHSKKYIRDLLNKSEYKDNMKGYPLEKFKFRTLKLDTGKNPEEKRRKWGLDRMMAENAYSTETNIDKRSNNVMVVYRNNTDIIINVWVGNQGALV